MIYFIDASSLLKLYRAEPGTDTMRELLRGENSDEMYISDHIALEVIVRLNKLRRTARRRDRRLLDRSIATFNADRAEYLNVSFVQPEVIERGEALAAEFDDAGAGTLDIIHLSTALHVQSTVPDERLVFVVSDRKLRHVVRRAGMAVFDPETQPLSELGPHPML